MGSASLSIVGLQPSTTVKVEKPLKPLNELQIVLILGLRQLFNLNMFLYVALLKSLLQNFEVLNELPLVPSFPVHLPYFYLAREHYIEDLTIHCSSSQLLDSRNIEFE